MPLKGCALLPEESWPGCALQTHPDIPGDALQLFPHTEKDVPFTASRFGSTSGQDLCRGQQHQGGFYSSLLTWDSNAVLEPTWIPGIGREMAKQKEVQQEQSPQSLLLALDELDPHPVTSLGLLCPMLMT